MADGSSLDAAAQRRLASALSKIAENDLHECPICMEVPVAKDARVLRCCAAIMCRHCIPSCKQTCPFCRCPFPEDRQENADGESPYTYTTQDYSVHTDYVCSRDYTVARRSYDSRDYSSSTSYTSQSYTSSVDYTSTSSYSTSSYTATNYSSSSYTATNDYSNSSGDKYSVSDDKYKASSTDYSAIADKYKAT